MTEVPRAIASGSTAASAPDDRVAPRRAALALGLVAAGFVFALYGVREVPGRAIELLGGAGHGVARYGGIVATATSGERIEKPGISQANAAESIAILTGGGLQFREVIESEAAAELEKLGIVGESGDPFVLPDQWHVEGRDEVHHDFYLCGHDRHALEAAFAQAMQRGWRPPPGTEILYERIEPSATANDHRVSWRSYFVAKAVEVDGRAIADALGTWEPYMNRPVVLVDFNRDGARAFGALTGRIVGHKLATVLGGDVTSAPIIEEPIRGGRASITMGAEPTAEHERDVLVEVLRAGATPLDGTDARWVAPSTPAREPLARLLLALVAGLVAGACAWLVVATTRPERRRVAPLAGAPVSRVKRVLWTGFAIAVDISGTYIVAPGINDVELGYGHGKSSELGAVSVFGLGLGPLIASFVIVEIAASIAPRWRPLRDTVLGRRRLAIAIAIVTCIVAATRAYLTVGRLADRANDMPIVGGFWLAVVSLTAGCMCLAVLASVIGSRGVGSGYGVLVVVIWLWSSCRYLAAAPSADLVLIGTAIAATAIIALAVLGWRIRAPGRVAIPLPVAGMLPLHAGGGLVALVGVVGVLGWRVLPEPLFDVMFALDHGRRIGAVVVVIATAVWAFALARPGRRRAELSAAGLEPTNPEAWLRAVVLSAAVALALYAIALVRPRLYGGLTDPITVAFAAAVIADLLAEWRDRAHAQLVPVWSLHDPLLADAARERLTAAGIPHHIQSTRLRSLLWLAGSYVPMMVLVPGEHAEAAHAVMRDWLSSP